MKRWHLQLGTVVLAAMLTAAVLSPWLAERRGDGKAGPSGSGSGVSIAEPAWENSASAPAPVTAPRPTSTAGTTLASPASGPVFSPTAGNWPMFRGNGAQTGLAEGALGKDLVLGWTFTTGEAVRSSPVIQDGRVYVGSGDGKLYCLRLDDGQKEWEFSAGDAVDAPPLVVDGKVLFGTNGGEFFALDAAKGTRLWQFKTGEKIVGSANYFRRDGQLCVVVGSWDFKVYCLAGQDGRQLWSVSTGNYINGSPAIDEGRICVGGCDSLLHVIGAAEGTQQAAIDVGAYIGGSSAMDQQMVYVGNFKGFHAIDLKTESVAWSYPGGGEAFFSSPAMADDRLVVGSRDNALHCLARPDGHKLWSFQTQGKVDSSPVICDGKVVFGSEDGRVYMVNLEDGKELWRYEVGELIDSSPAVAGGWVVIGSDDGKVYAFGPARTTDSR